MGLWEVFWMAGELEWEAVRPQHRSPCPLHHQSHRDHHDAGVVVVVVGIDAVDVVAYYDAHCGE